MVNIQDLGLMTFSEASRRWNFESSYVYQIYRNNPNRLLAGSFDSLKTDNSGKGTFVITREGMEYLTGKTEQQANAESWKVIVLKDTNIVNEQVANSEKNAHFKFMKLIKTYLEDTGDSIQNVPKPHYLDNNSKNFGVRLDNGVIIYYKKTKE